MYFVSDTLELSPATGAMGNPGLSLIIQFGI